VSTSERAAGSPLTIRLDGRSGRRSSVARPGNGLVRA
jgi:hypothetical protein